MNKLEPKKKKALWIVSLFVFAALTVTFLTFAISVYFLRPESKPAQKEIKTEVATPQELVTQAIPLPIKKKAQNRIKIAIIIDDIGNSLETAKEIIGIDAPITLSILPNLPHSKDIAALASGLAIETMLHMPMEPHNNHYNYDLFTPLTERMGKNEIEALTHQYMSAVPNAVGVNNHQGSSFTEDRKGMGIFLNVIKNEGLFFVDSYTTPKTVGYKMARKMGIPSAGRTIFLDNINEPKAIMKEFIELEQIAKKRGSAIAIGHPRKNTIALLKEMVEYYEEIGIEIVPVSELVK